jgi:ABC-2 type transport system permease protein
LIALALRRKTVDTIVNALALIVVVGTFMLSNMLAVSASNPLLNLVSPIYLVTNVFAMISMGPVSHFMTTYLLSLIVLLVIGGLSYRHIKILPTEGL